MISKKTLRLYEFNSIEDYFNYIIDSQINGNNQQVKDLFKKLDQNQKRDYFYYLKNNEIKFNYTGLF